MDKATKRNRIVLIGIACVTVILLCYQGGILGNDYWWHVKVGEWICENKSIPHADIFSWYASSHGVAFTAHEWLADVIFYGITNIFGDIGMLIFSIAFALTLVGIMLMYNRKRIPENNIVGGFIFFILFCVLELLTIYGRPQIFSFAFLWYELFVLYRFIENEKSRLIYTLPILSVLWSNTHGGSSNLSYIFCLIVLVCGMFSFSNYKIEAKKLSFRQIKILSVTAVLSAAAICINPYGTHMLLYPYQNVQDTFMWSIISEWAAPDAKNISEVILYYFPIFIVIASMIFSRKKIRLTDGIITLFFLFLFFRSQRFIMFFLIAASIYAFDYPCFKIKLGGKKEKLAINALCVLLVVVSLSAFPEYVELCSEGEIIEVALSQDFVGLIEEEKPEHLFNDYNYGETLIYNDIPVFFDSRADVYSGELIQDGVSLLLLKNSNINSNAYYLDIEKLIEKYNFDAFVIDVSRPLYSYMKSHPEKYAEIKCDGSAAYFSLVS